jgi:hypothetical protein
LRPRRRLQRSTLRVALLLAYGAVIATAACSRLGVQHPPLGLNVQRQADLTTAVRVTSRGGPPLVGVQTGGYYPLAYNDDRGAYVYLPLIGAAVGTADLQALLKWFFVGMFGPLFLLYPLLFYELTSSLALSLISPAVVWWKFQSAAGTGLYWLPAWSVLFALPVVLVLYKRWNSWSIPLLGLVTAVGSVATSIRANAGLPILLAAILVGCARIKPWGQRAVVVAVLVLCSLCVSTVAMTAVQRHRDRIVGANFSQIYPATHPTWHSVYIGLGYVPNKYGIRWDDVTAFDYARSKDPNVALYSKTYESILRRRYFHVVLTDPSFAARVYLVKAAVLVRALLHRYWLAGVAVLLALLMAQRSPRAAHVTFFLVVSLVALVGAAVSPLLTLPNADFYGGVMGVAAVAGLLALGWIGSAVESAVRDISRSRAWLQHSGPRWMYVGRRFPRSVRRLLSYAAPWVGVVMATLAAGAGVAHPSRRRVVVLAGAAAAVAALALNPDATGADARSFYMANEGTLVARTDTPAVTAWKLGRGLPMGWGTDPKAVVNSHDGVLHIRTGRGRFTNQLASTVTVLPPGDYEARVRGRVASGVLRLGVLDDTANAWIGADIYWWGQRGFARSEMVVPFALANTTRVRLVLSNNAVDNASTSSWRLDEARITGTSSSACLLNAAQPWYAKPVLYLPERRRRAG